MKFRKLHVGDQIWEYFVGKLGDSVVIKPPEEIGKKVVVKGNEITGQSPEEMSRGRMHGTTPGMIRPAQIKRYIQRNWDVPADKPKQKTTAKKLAEKRKVTDALKERYGILLRMRSNDRALFLTTPKHLLDELLELKGLVDTLMLEEQDQKASEFIAVHRDVF